jgi:hypothetical protein
MGTTFPSRSDYETVIRRLDLFAADSAVKAGKVLMRKDGLFPQAFSGGRAVVFPVIIKSRKYAIKCWIQSLGALEERYQAISQLIQSSKPPYLIESVYREKELLFNGTRYPVLQMQWSESRTLKEWISAHINDSSLLSDLAQRFLEVVADMHSINMSHGDLQHENILISDSSAITLVDYDSIYLKGLDHLDDEVKGLPGFQHQSRSRQAKASPKSDYLSEYVIYTTLVALSKKPELWKQAKDHNRLLFSQDDLSNPKSSDLFRILKTIDGLSDLVDEFQTQCLCLNLEDIVPIESLLVLPKSSPPPTSRKRSTARDQSTTTTKRELGSAKDLRKAQTWKSSQDITAEWMFGDLDRDAGCDDGGQDAASVANNKPNASVRAKSDSRSPSKQSKVGAATDNSSRHEPESQSGSNRHPWPCVKTPKHTVEGCLSSQDIPRQNLSAISFEKLFLRLICIATNGLKNELLISKERLIGWRGIGVKLELVTSNFYGGTDVLTVTAPNLSDTGSIAIIIKQLKDAGIDVAWPARESGDSRVEKSINQLNDRQGNRQRVDASPNAQDCKPNWRFTSNRRFSYATVDDIVYCTGLPLRTVEDAIKTLQLRAPFSLGEANRIAGFLLGEPSIQKAFDRRYSSKGVSVQSQPVPKSDPVPNKPNNSAFDKNVNISSHWHSTGSNERSSYFRKFAYSSIDDIVNCTGKPHNLVMSAISALKVNPPFTLIEADRIAGFLLGDPSIRRAFEKTLASQGSNNQGLSDERLAEDAIPANSNNDSSRASKPSNGSDQISLSDPKENTIESKGDCFVATAIYETECHPELTILRDYRDRVLLSSRLGRHFCVLLL